MIQQILEELFDTGTEIQEEPAINTSLVDQEARAKQAKREADAQRLVIEKATAKLAAQKNTEKADNQSTNELTPKEDKNRESGRCVAAFY